MPANPIGVALRGRRAGHHTLAWVRPGLQAPENFTLTSPAFGHGAPIPEKHRGRLFGANISPELNWTQPPPGTAELVLIVQDPDVPFGKPATHALTLGIDPSRSGIPENALANPSPVPGIRHGKGAMGKRGWAGPLPPRSHGLHTYAFQLFALDQATGLSASFTLDDTLAAIKGHIIGRARLDGTYESASTRTPARRTRQLRGGQQCGEVRRAVKRAAGQSNRFCPGRPWPRVLLSVARASSRTPSSTGGLKTPSSSSVSVSSHAPGKDMVPVG